MRLGSQSIDRLAVAEILPGTIIFACVGLTLTVTNALSSAHIHDLKARLQIERASPVRCNARPAHVVCRTQPSSQRAS